MYKESIYRIGDRVRVISRVDGSFLKGLVGTVKALAHSGSRYDIGVEFDKNIGGHDLTLDGIAYAKPGHGRWGNDCEFEFEYHTNKPLPCINKKEFEKLITSLG